MSEGPPIDTNKDSGSASQKSGPTKTQLAGIAAVIVAITGFVQVLLPDGIGGLFSDGVGVTTTTQGTATTQGTTATQGTTTAPSTSLEVPSTTGPIAEPLTVFVEADPQIFSPEVDWTPFHYVFASTLGQIGGPPSTDCRTWHNWARGLDAADVSTMFQLSLTTKEETVLVDGFAVEVIRRDPPIHGVLVSCPVGGADVNPRRIEIDLDSDPPRVTYLRNPNEDDTPTDLTLSISPGEIELLEVWAFTDSCDCDWTATLYYVVNGERHSVEITNSGEAFRTSGTRNAETWYWDAAQGDWVPFLP